MASIRVAAPDRGAVVAVAGIARSDVFPVTAVPYAALAVPTPAAATAAAATAAPPADGLLEGDRRFLQRFCRVIVLRHADPELRLAALCAQLALSERALQRKVRQLLGCRPAEYLRSYRLDRARLLLAAGWQVGQVVERVGFAGHAYFSSCFKAAFGVSPSAYRDAQLAAQRQARGWRGFPQARHDAHGSVG